MTLPELLQKIRESEQLGDKERVAFLQQLENDMRELEQADPKAYLALLTQANDALSYELKTIKD